MSIWQTFELQIFNYSACCNCRLSGIFCLQMTMSRLNTPAMNTKELLHIIWNIYKVTLKIYIIGCMIRLSFNSRTSFFSGNAPVMICDQCIKYKIHTHWLCLEKSGRVNAHMCKSCVMDNALRLVKDNCQFVLSWEMQSFFHGELLTITFFVYIRWVCWTTKGSWWSFDSW